MFEKIKTSIAYTKNLFVTGAISQSCRSVEIEICRNVPKEDYKIIVEFGMGHGNITREILKNMAPNSKLFAFEVNENFCDQVRNRINDERLIIINDGAENIKKHLQQEVHSVIASMPLSFFSKEKQVGIIQDVYDVLANDAYYTHSLYSKIPFKKFQKIFDSCYIEKINDNIPTAYIYHCKKIAV